MILTSRPEDETLFLREVQREFSLSRREIAVAAEAEHSVIQDILAGHLDRHVHDRYGCILTRRQFAALLDFLRCISLTAGFTRRDGARLIPGAAKYQQKDGEIVYPFPYRLLTGFAAQ